MSSFLHTAGGLCSQKPMIYLAMPHSDPCYFLSVALRLQAPRRASFVTRNAIWLRQRTLHQREEEGRGSHREGIKPVQVQQLSVKCQKQRKKQSKLVPAHINSVQENVRSHFSLLLSYVHAWKPVFDQQVRLTEYFHIFPSSVPLMARMPVLPSWIPTCLFCP